MADAESAGRGAAGGGDAGRGFAGGDKGSRAAGGRAAANGAATSSGGVVSGRIVAARRKVRRVREVLDTFADQPCLTAFQSDRGTALIPLDDAAAPDHGRLRALVADAAAAAGVEVTAAVVLAEPADVPAAAARTAEILDLVRATGRPPGLYRLADVLLDYQLSRPSPALAALAARLDALAPKPELLATLETYLKLGRDRRAVAAALHVHPNTIDYRLRRISVLTGLSPNRAEDLGELHASLVARQVLGDGL
ncbi:MAG: helix-turn-helix domain-containing protein [Catenulispora sp.]|nr:helix-turn-helix domain-containing protein [Catenulispora sp.]